MTLLNGTDMAQMLGMTKQAFGAGVKSGRFSIAQRGRFGHPLFDPSVVKTQFDATRSAAELQDHARILPPELRGGRPVINKNDTKNDAENEAKKKEEAEQQKKFLQAKLAKEVAQVKHIDLKYKVESGLYIEKIEAKKQGVELAEMIMGILQSWPSRLAPELAAMKDSDEHDFHRRLESEVNALIIAIRQRCGREERGSDG